MLITFLIHCLSRLDKQSRTHVSSITEILNRENAINLNSKEGVFGVMMLHEVRILG